MAKGAQRKKGTKATRRGDSENLQSSNLFREMSNSVEKRRNKKRQELRRKHRSQAKKAEENIRDMFRVNKSAFDEYRTSRMRKLSELVKKRSEIEVKMITLLQSARGKYEAINSGISNSVEERLANLR